MITGAILIRELIPRKVDSFIEEYSQPDNYTEATKIKSDGGSSDYYKLEINGNLVEVEDVIYAMVGGDFILGNIPESMSSNVP